MKNIAISLLAALAFSATAFGAEKHDHDHGKKGPNGGRVIESVEPHLEFLVKDDRKVQITVLSDDLKPVPATEQTVTVTMGDRSAPTKLTFEKSGDVFISDKAIPEGDSLPTVVQIKMTPDAKTVTEKFNLDMAKCPECKNAEYACICEEGAGHKH